MTGSADPLYHHKTSQWLKSRLLLVLVEAIGIEVVAVYMWRERAKTMKEL